MMSMKPMGSNVAPLRHECRPRVACRSAVRWRRSLAVVPLLAALWGGGCGSTDSSSDGDGSGLSGTPPVDGVPGTAQYVATAAALSPTAEHLKLTMVEVGQGDGFFVTFPDKTAVAIDGGPDRFAAYRDFVTATIKEGTRLQYVLLSHGHSDHYTGLTTAIDFLPKDCVARVFDPGYDRPDTPGYVSFKTAAGCRYQTLGKGMSLGLYPSVHLEVLNVASVPFPMVDGTGINNTSAVTYLRFGRFAALFTGDAQTEAERILVNERAGNLRANVLKVGHHGSCNATATSLLSAVAPQYALISAATPNDFGHPHCQTIGKLKTQGVHWLRADSNGGVTIETDGDKYTVTYARGSVDDPTCPRNCASPSDF